MVMTAVEAPTRVGGVLRRVRTRPRRGWRVRSNYNGDEKHDQRLPPSSLEQLRDHSLASEGPRQAREE